MSTDSSPASAASSSQRAAPRRSLTLFDAMSIIVGIIIGAGIYEATPRVAGNVDGLAAQVAIWIIGGLLAALGALCYADLACAHPEDGGDYVYLKRAFGLRTAFVFAWCEFWIVRPGAIGAMAFIFARYANELKPLGESSAAYGAYAIGAIVVLSAINMLGVRQGKWVQNLLTVAKVLGLVAMFVVAWSVPAAEHAAAGATPHLAVAGSGAAGAAGSEAGAAGFATNYPLALILVLFAYGGWSDVAYVAAEVRNPNRNLLAALLGGIALVATIYVAANLAFVHALGVDGLRASHAAAADVMALRWGDAGGRAISLLICISTLGAINGQLFTGARIYYALGADHALLARLGRWNARLGTPLWSLVAQTVATLLPVLVIVFLTPAKQPTGSGATAGAEACRDAFERLVVFNTPVYWFFFMLVGLTVFVLSDRNTLRGLAYRVPWYPWTPLAFCAMSAWMLWSSCVYSFQQRNLDDLGALAILATGIVLSRWTTRDAGREDRPAPITRD